ncbi:metallophosphoesterase [Paraburkholderia rhizosphaerae]|uniref:Calcineurin-like phosphoesterase family protein n=1 Tax=Paraburkholderia rhizosphaerae TaxID=480658 RepID=A0A4R8LPK2_9BURK|nr:metallophosphoesterase [Paraburkholderia rhizosphaerae]TDY48247.1 calcineurin-like phosphoesterase family protein [Paraburkholderia rhizosphaerae]
MLLLHVSDIHFRSPDCLDPGLDPERPYRTILLQDVRARVRELGPVSAVLVGGDIAFKGATDEYDAAWTWLKELAAAAGCPLERVFVVPGNHDVDRNLSAQSVPTRNAQAAIMRAPADSRERELRNQIRDQDTGRALLAPIAAYNEFAKLLNCQVYLPERLYWKQDLDLGQGVLLRVHGLTSVILSGAEGHNDTRESLYLSPLQTVLDPVDDVVNLVLCHHPPDWFMDQDDANDAICGRATIHMFGHKHRQRVQLDRQYVRFSAGAVNPDRNEVGWNPGYNLVEVDVTGTGVDRQILIAAHLRQWQSNPDMFRAVQTPEGESVFRHTIRFPGEAHTAALSVAASAPNASRAASVVEQAPAVRELSGYESDTDGEAAMGNTSARNLVFRFWNLRASERRDIVQRLDLISEAELNLPEPERYGRALIRASERGILDLLAREIARKET